MAIKTSTEAAKIVASPQVPLASGAHASRTVVSHEILTVPINANGDVVVTSVSVPAQAKLISVETGNAAGGAGTMDVGLFRQDGSTFVAVDDDCIVAAQAVTGASARAEKLTYDKLGKKAWEIAGLAEAPSYNELFVGLTFDTANTGTMVTAVKVSFIPE